MTYETDKEELVDKENENQRIDRTYSVLMKLFYYLGLSVFLPYLIIQITQKSGLGYTYASIQFLVGFTVGDLLMFLLMDYIGMKSSYLDRISRLITLIISIVAALISGALFLYISNDGWDLNFSLIVSLSIALMICFGYLGWFFVRSERGLSSSKTKPLLITSSWALLIGGILFLMEALVPGLLFLGLLILFAAYPVLIIFWGKPKVVPDIKPRKIVQAYKRTTFYNYVIDIAKATAVVVTLVAVSYNGSVLYPQGVPSTSLEWIPYLALINFVAAIGMALFTKLQDKFYGLIPIILLYGICIFQYVAVHVFLWEWGWLVAALNGISFAGVFFFIEQKIYKSNNVRSMPGSFYILIFIIITVAIVLRINPEFDFVLENIKLVVSVAGIIYIIGYIREAPKQESLRISI